MKIYEKMYSKANVMRAYAKHCRKHCFNRYAGESSDSQGISVNIDVYNTTEQIPYAQFYLAGYDDGGEKLVYVEKYERSIDAGASCASFTAEVTDVTDETYFKLFA